MNTPIQIQNRQEACILYALGFLFLPVAVLATAQVWVLAVIGVLGIPTVRAVHGRFDLKPNGLLVVLMILLVGWVAMSSLWSITPDRAIKTTFRIALVCLSLIVLIDATNKLDQDQRRRFGHWLVGGTMVGLVLTGFFVLSSDIISVWLNENPATGHELATLNRTSTVIALLVWPVALIVAQICNRYAAAAVIVLSALLLFALAPSTPLVAFAVGLIAFVLAWVSHGLGKRILLMGFAASVIAIPLLDVLAPPVIEILTANISWPNSEVHRLVIWQFAAERIFEHPLVGWGLDASRAIPGKNEELFLFQVGTHSVTGQAMPLHPHNALIQIWLELGLVGIILIGAMFSLIVASIPTSAHNRAGSATLIATTACALSIAQLGFGVWQGWWMATLGLMVMVAIATATHVSSPPARQSRPDRNI